MARLKDFQRIRSHLRKKLNLLDRQLGNFLKDPQLQNSTQLIELQIMRLQVLDKLKYLRPYTSEDITYREKVLTYFPDWAAEHISDDMRLVFHGTTLANTERILNSGRIISGKDRWTIRTSGDERGQISVSTNNSLLIPLVGHMDLVAQSGCLPAGTLFVLQVSESEYQQAKDDYHIPNVSFRKDPQKLYAIVTTPENVDRVKWWAQKNNFPSEKVSDFATFKNKIEEDQIYFSLLKNYHQDCIK